MISLLLLMLSLAEPEPRQGGTPQNVETHYNTVDHLWRGVASCYTKDNKDGGYTPHRIKCIATSDQACRDDLDRQARNGCRQ